MDHQSLRRSERLKSEKAISALFETGSSLSVPPIRLIYLLKSSPENIPIKIGFAVPKKNFKRAVDRNLIKRRMREAYRLNKYLITNEIENANPGIDIMLVYQGQKIEDYNKISHCVTELLKKLSLKTAKR